MTRDVPFTSSDLREAADRIDEVLTVVGGEDLPDNDWRWGLTVDIFDDASEVVGQLRPHGDGWIGFYPKAITTRDNRIFGGAE